MAAEEARISAAIESFARGLRVARASELALSGRSLEAAALLESDERVASSWEELDLLARIRVRERKLANAYRLWGRAAATMPPQAVLAHRCLASLEAHAAAIFRRELRAFILCWLAWTMSVLVVVFLVVSRTSR